MKVAASISVLALAATAVAVPAWPEPEPTTTTTTTTTPGWPAKTTTTTPAAVTTTEDVWADWETTTTTPAAITTTTPAAASETWADWEEPYSWTTTIVSTITTFVPKPTNIVHGGKTWEVTDATTLTITGWPLTVSVPVYTKVTTSCSSVPVAAESTWVDWEAAPTSSPVSPDVYVPSGTGVKPAAFTGAANSLVANVGAGLAGVGAIAAFLL
ncbi:hypothetical protein B0A52_06554 [Exophiala mesophila]|uniref:Uncharacterized protein n=1 Tax=Exophiala mesophila TaxID=212818 RepID=A0A438N185_EXOME|nr:hypothetical protein B0A52_06554 [Exophiala mesophila]